MKNNKTLIQTNTVRVHFMLAVFLYGTAIFFGLVSRNHIGYAQDPANSEVIEMLPVDSELNIRASVAVGIDPKEPFRRSRSWVPVRIELNNLDEDYSGNLIIQIKDGKVTYKTPVDLPARSKQLYTVYVYLPDNLDEVEFYLQDGRRKISFQVVTIAQPSIDSIRFIALLSTERGSHEHLAHRDSDEKAEMFRNVIYTSPLYLPKSWVGMQNIDVLIWDGMENVILTPEQELAVDQWIQMGGTLVLACGERWQMLDSSPLRLYSPVTMTGSTVLPAQQVLTSVSEKSESMILPSVVAATGDLLDDPKVTVRLKAGEHPFLVERPWGAGKIVWVASTLQTPLFDPLYQELLMRYLSTNNLSFTPTSIDNLDAPITSFLRWLVQAELPSTAFVAMYLGLYIIILVPVNYLVFRSIKRLEWAWFTIPVWALVFAYGAYYIGSFSQHAEIIANQISLIESKPNANFGSSTTFCSVYSPIRKWYTLRFEDPKAFPMLAAENMFRQQNNLASNESLTVSFEPNANRIDDFLIYHWSQRVFKAQHSVPVGEGVDLNVHFNENMLEGTITNNTPFTLNAPKLCLKDRIIAFGSMAPGDTVDVTGKWNNAQRLDPNNNMNWQMMQQQQDFGRHNRNMDQFIRDRLIDSYSQSYFQSTQTKGMMIFVAHADVSAMNFMLERSEIQPKGQSLFCVTAPVEQVITGIRTIQPHEWQFGTFGLSGFGYGGMGMGMPNNQFIPVQNQTEALGEIVTELPLEHGRIRWLRIKLDQQQLNRYQMGRVMQRQPNSQPITAKEGLYLRNRASSRYDHIDDIVDENGLINNPERYVDKPANKISIKYANPTDKSFQIPQDAIQITMEMDYGGKDDESFLGYSISLAREENRSSE